MKIIRHISPSGFIDSISFELGDTDMESLSVAEAIERLNDAAKQFQSVTVPTYKPREKEESTSPPAPRPVPAGGAPPPPATARQGQVVAVYPQSENPKAPLVVQFADGSKASTFDKAAKGLEGKTIKYGTVEKAGKLGGTFTNLQWFREAEF